MQKHIKKQMYMMGVIASMIYLGSCEYENYPLPDPPKQAKETMTLEASFTNASPKTLNHSFWKTADYRIVTLQDISTGSLYSDGYLNMTGTYTGLMDFNKGNSKPLIVKAAYDNSKLYVLMEWYDDDLDAFSGSWLYNGPIDSKKTDDTKGWTSQRGSDMVSLSFDINGATSAAGTFNKVGCAASCHNNTHKPQSGSADIWKWSLALSDPLGYAMDLIAEASGLIYDAGKPMAVRNTSGPTARSGPAYEWDGNSQSYTRPDGKATLLDPAFFLLSKATYRGNVNRGDSLYKTKCASCHGANGEGGDGPGFNTPGILNRFSRAAFNSAAESHDHTGYTYYEVLNANQRDDVASRVKAFGGFPGHYLQAPDGSQSDIWAVSNVSHITMNSREVRTVYKVLLIRNLTTGNADDIQFGTQAGKSFPFGIALMDNDGINHVGSVLETLTFKAK